MQSPLTYTKTYTKVRNLLLTCVSMLAIVLTLGIQPASAQVTCDSQFLHGQPVGAPETNIQITRENYCLSFNPDRKFADWIGYHQQTADVQGDARDYYLAKENQLTADQVLEIEDFKGIYEGQGMDKGHLAPLTLFRTGDTRSISYMGNIVPQKVVLNRGVWRVLENWVRDQALTHPDIYVITGTLYEQDMPAMPASDENHKVPSGFWKVVQFDDQVYCYLFNQDVEKGGKIEDGLISPDELEARTGLQMNLTAPV